MKRVTLFLRVYGSIILPDKPAKRVYTVCAVPLDGIYLHLEIRHTYHMRLRNVCTYISACINIYV